MFEISILTAPSNSSNRRRIFAIQAAISLTALLLAHPSFGADEKVEFPQASQHAILKQRVGLTDIEVDYSRPNKNGRDIFGGLVPFDKPWRTGANQPTKIKTSAPVKLADKEVPAGNMCSTRFPARTNGRWSSRKI